jgi:hypothetical protein
MTSINTDDPVGPRKPKKGNTMTTMATRTPADTRMPQSIEKTKADYQQMVKVSPDEIAQRAYELFMARGGAHGNDVDDWLVAESELMRARGMRQANA